MSVYLCIAVKVFYAVGYTRLVERWECFAEMHRDYDIVYLRQGDYGMPGVWLSVCLLRKHHWTDLHENITADVGLSVDKEDWLNFGSHPLPDLSRNVLKGFFNLARAFFHNLAQISGHTDMILMKILPQMCLCTRKNWLNFGSHPLLDPDPGIF